MLKLLNRAISTPSALDYHPLPLQIQVQQGSVRPIPTALRAPSLHLPAEGIRDAAVELRSTADRQFQVLIHRFEAHGERGILREELHVAQDQDDDPDRDKA